MSPGFFKKPVKRLLRPIARPVLRRIDARFDPLRDDLAALTDNLPVLLNTISSQNAMARESRRAEFRLSGEVRDLGKRVEVVREELLAELRRLAASAPPDDITGSRILAPEKLAAAGPDIRLNLGCGKRALPDFVNVDTRPGEGVDLMADVQQLPYGPGTVSHIHSVNLLEHYPVDELAQLLLPYWLALLKAGGRMSAVVTDAESAIADFSAERISFEELQSLLFGYDQTRGGTRRTMFSESSIRELLDVAGFVDVRVERLERRDGARYLMEVEGFRPTLQEPRRVEPSLVVPTP